jgi:hypothetical protein
MNVLTNIPIGLCKPTNKKQFFVDIKGQFYKVVDF